MAAGEEGNEMNTNTTDRELLVRIDERVEALHSWTQAHEAEHKEQRATLHKWLGILVTLVGGILTKLIFWE